MIESSHEARTFSHDRRAMSARGSRRAGRVTADGVASWSTSSRLGGGVEHGGAWRPAGLALTQVMTARAHRAAAGATSSASVKDYREHSMESRSAGGFEAGREGASDRRVPGGLLQAGPCCVVADGPGDLHAHITSSVDYEAELAIVSGAAAAFFLVARRVHIFGYTLVCEVSARDGRQHMQFFLGQALDTFARGVVDHEAERSGCGDIECECGVNGGFASEGHTRGDLIFEIPTDLHHFGG
jgi:hypothetical protein